jgi:type III restriction enzyme
LDSYVRQKLFSAPFDPFENNNWKVLLLKNGIVTQHIIRELGKMVYEMQNSVSASETVVEKRHFSEIDVLRMRENYSLPIVKTIYQRLRYPSNKGQFEKGFLEYADSDGQVEAIMRIEEYQHTFAVINYIRTDGFLASYHPDFLVKTSNKVYLIETKADKDINDVNVRQKQLATLDWVKRINALKAEDRMSKEWEYVLLGESNFYGLSKNGASVGEICELAKVSEAGVSGRLL